MRITYLGLLNSAIFMVVMTGICAAGYGLYGNPFSPVTLGLSAFVIAAWALVGARLRRSAGDGGSIWARPVSDGIGHMIINGVMAIWLTFVVATAILFIVISRSVMVTGIALVLMLATTYLGRALGKNLPRKSLLPYGVAALGALLVFLTVVLIAH